MLIFHVDYLWVLRTVHNKTTAESLMQGNAAVVAMVKTVGMAEMVYKVFKVSKVFKARKASKVEMAATVETG